MHAKNGDAGVTITTKNIRLECTQVAIGRDRSMASQRVKKAFQELFLVGCYRSLWWSFLVFLRPRFSFLLVQGQERGISNFFEDVFEQILFNAECHIMSIGAFDQG